MRERVFRNMLATASRAPMKSEALGLGDAEFAPWGLGRQCEASIIMRSLNSNSKQVILEGFCPDGLAG